MRIVAIETSGKVGSIAVAEDDVLLLEHSFERGMQHGRELVPRLKELLEHANWRPREIDVIAVSIGPGSYTGLRVGVTCAKMFAFLTPAKIVAVPTLDVLASNAPPEAENVCPVVDAKRRQVYAAIYDNSRKRVSDFLAISPAKLLEILPRPVLLLGDGLEAHADVLCGDGIVAAEPSRWRARASVVAAMGYRIHLDGKYTEPNELTPMYLRRPEAEEMWDKKQGAR